MSKTYVSFDRVDESMGNYARMQNWLISTGRVPPAPGQVCEMSVEHDRWCNVQTTHVPPCTCEPNVIDPAGRVWTWAEYMAGRAK